jgi:hypothetical protein
MQVTKSMELAELEAMIGGALTLASIGRGDPPMIGTRYRIDKILGSGGFGTVVRAHDSELDRAVAIKLVPANEPALQGRRAVRPGRAELLQGPRDHRG